MRTSKILEGLQASILLGMFAASAILWGQAPERIPVHWNLAGEPDRYGGKFEGLLLAPLIGLGLYLLLLVLTWIASRYSTHESFARGSQIIRLALVLFFALIHATILLVAFGHPVDVSFVVPLGLGILFCILGNFLGKIRPNWFVGVRTPWTLSSAASWQKTNRLAGRLFLLTGAALILLAMVHNAWTLAIVLGMVAFMVIWLPIYSYRIWRQDPERVTKVDPQP
ncbi:MAG: SdpI family protein [Pirellulales bacterium]|nr:SdpI family protein [Pirellulales bacterium]